MFLLWQHLLVRATMFCKMGVLYCHLFDIVSKALKVSNVSYFLFSNEKKLALHPSHIKWNTFIHSDAGKFLRCISKVNFMYVVYLFAGWFLKINFLHLLYLWNHSGMTVNQTPCGHVSHNSRRIGGFVWTTGVESCQCCWLSTLFIMFMTHCLPVVLIYPLIDFPWPHFFFPL